MVERRRRFWVVLISLLIMVAGAIYQSYEDNRNQIGDVESAVTTQDSQVTTTLAVDTLSKLPIKGRAPKTDYKRTQFSDGWDELPGCDVRNYILKRDMTGVVTQSETDCTVMQGTLDDPYTGKTIQFVRGPSTSDDVQIDHMVALSNAWQTGAQQISAAQRHALSNDPLNLLAVDGPENQKKGDSDAATWLPPNKAYRCRYVARQIAVKIKYALWVTQAEHDAIERTLEACPGQLLPIVGEPSGTVQ